MIYGPLGYIFKFDICISFLPDYQFLLESSRIDENEEPKSVQNARSTDLLFLKSVVASNTLERQKKVGFIFYIKYNEKLPMNTRIQELSDKDLQCYTLQTWDIPQDLK